jgi:enolase-phosphatase E1
MYLCAMNVSNITHIVTDIEGTTTSVDFVYKTLFPYFREHLNELLEMREDTEVQKGLIEAIELYYSMEKGKASTDEGLMDILREWSLKDLKLTPLKTLQGIIWKKGYLNGNIKGHVYPDVPEQLKKWQQQNIHLSIFSSGSVAAQKLLFGHSMFGDLTSYFSAYFDTETGTKRDSNTYVRIASILNANPQNMLFFSDIAEELDAAKKAGMQTIQLVREKTNPSWIDTASSFKDIQIENMNL